jgi:hypothetical protein
MEILASYRSIIELVKLRQFNLHQRDYHGRTLCHVLLEIYPGVSDANFICPILDMLQPDINSFDNLANCLKDLVVRRLIQKHSLSALQRFKIQEYNDPLTSILNFKESIQCDNFSMSLVKRNRQITKLFIWVDGSGDTLLSALIKSWPMEADELALAGLVTELLQLGSDVHMRDRHGNTPLANAVRLGSRPVVALLLKANSNIHIRDYKGNSIIGQGRLCLLQAKKDQDDRRYATILSCMNALVDAGAKADPTVKDELFTPTARARGANQSWTIIQRDELAPSLAPC